MERNEHQIDVEILRKSINLIFDHITNDLSIKRVNLPEGKRLYFTLGLDEAFDLKSDPSDLTVGDVYDDFEFLKTMVDQASSSNDAPALMLEHAAGVLRAVAAIVRG